jgi:hypothetical protein
MRGSFMQSGGSNAAEAGIYTANGIIGATASVAP